MKTIKKIVVGIVCIILVASITIALVAHVRNDSDDGYTKTIVYLGDSIAEGILGASPFSERDSYCYYAVVGRSNNYRYVNCSVSGDTTINLYKRIIGDNTRAKERRYWITQADVIHISILGNDLLGGDISQTAIDAAVGNTTNIDKMIDSATNYFKLSLDKIRELNPDAVIMVNTVYNPLDVQSTLLTSAKKARLIEALGGNEGGIRTTGTYLLNRLNKVVYDYLSQNPNSIEIIDVYTAFDNLYNTNKTEGLALLYKDWLHPSNEGHALMASLIQQRLQSLGLANANFALPRYKILRIEQLERLFEGTSVNIDKTKKDIAEANSFDDVTRAYFSSIRGITPLYAGNAVTRRKGEVFETTKEYKVTSIALGTDDFTFTDKELSKFTFNQDGTFSLKLVPNKTMLAMANIALAVMLKDGLNLNEALGTGGNFDTGLEVYIKNIFPGFDFREFRKILDILTSVGIHLNGIYFQDESIIALTESLKSNMTIPAGFIIPSDLSIELKGYYFVEKAGDFTNIHMCVNNVSSDGYPFLYASLHTEADGSAWIETAIEVSKIIVKGCLI